MQISLLINKGNDDENANGSDEIHGRDCFPDDKDDLGVHDLDNFDVSDADDDSDVEDLYDGSDDDFDDGDNNDSAENDDAVSNDVGDSDDVLRGQTQV